MARTYTLLDQSAPPTLDLYHSKGISVFAGAVYNGGILATGALAPTITIAKRRRKSSSVSAKRIYWVKIAPRT
jgi:aryl-alcohol dehydrogenase-like predicted oxidoreductase